MAGSLSETNLFDKVIFEEPDVMSLAEEGFICADMHFHTDASDSFTKVTDAVRLAKQRGLALAITDHNLISNAMKVAGRKDIVIIPGMEVSTTDGPHILVWFYDQAELQDFWKREIKDRLQSCPWLALKDCTVEQLLNRLESENCVVQAAHPMGYFGNNKGLEGCIRKGYLPPALAKRMDAYEAICQGMTHSANLEAARAARGYRIGVTGGSDGHILDAVGTAVTAAYADSREELLDAIAAKRTLAIGKEKNLSGKILTGSASFTRFLEHAPSATRAQAGTASRSLMRAVKKIRNQGSRKQE